MKTDAQMLMDWLRGYTMATGRVSKQPRKDLAVSLGLSQSGITRLLDKGRLDHKTLQCVALNIESRGEGNTDPIEQTITTDGFDYQIRRANNGAKYITWTPSVEEEK